ncbi:MAG: IS200/IS605 family transposase [Victivallales bacterium]|nr:IS200/IS605 family transposase [Victivallales bacterium]
MSYTRCYYHIIFRTKSSEQTLPVGADIELYRYIWGFCKNKKTVLFQINGMPEHLHIFVSLPPTLALSDFVKEVKNSTNLWLKENKALFPYFRGWADGYAGLSYGESEKAAVIEYIKNQKIHHRAEAFQDELRRVLIEGGFTVDERYFLTNV